MGRGKAAIFNTKAPNGGDCVSHIYLMEECSRQRKE